MDNNNQNRNGRKRPSGQNIGVLALILVITLIAVTVMNNMVRKNQTQELGYEEFVEYLKEGDRYGEDLRGFCGGQSPESAERPRENADPL